jgi:hypothetical protein
MNSIRTTLAVACTTALLAACGDNPQDAPETPPGTSGQVPASATASPRAYAQFAASLQASENGTPLSVGDVTPPTSETEAPLAL